MHLLALDIGGTKIAGAVVTIADETTTPNAITGTIPTTAPVLSLQAEIPTAAQRGGQDVALRVGQFARSLQEQAHAAGTPIAMIGVSSAGVVDCARGRIVSATDLMPGWGGIELAQHLQNTCRVPTRVLNDVHAHALGEQTWGAGMGHSDALVIAVGTGIGGAVIAAGQLQLGAHGLAGHLGHTTYLEGPYLPCSCGRLGHVEAIASGTGVANLYREFTEDEHGTIDGFGVYQRAMDGDAAAIRALSTSARALGQAIGNLANCFDPGVVILSGSMTRSGDIWWDALHAGYADQAMDLVANVPLLAGTLGGNAPLLGAVRFALR